MVPGIMPMDDRLEALEVLPGHDAWVQVRKQAALLEHADDRGPDVGQRAAKAVRVQPLAGLGPAVPGLAAQGEHGLFAAKRRALAGDRQHLVGLQVQAVLPVQDGGECAVAAAVPPPFGTSPCSPPWARTTHGASPAVSVSLSPHLFGRKGPMAGQ
ncbi:MAG: hypothetical protein QOG05_1729 [Streptosporangiaceae bacterium]|nr:hypothetical protein [Streptosporangiaceae bacterium]